MIGGSNFSLVVNGDFSSGVQAEGADALSQAFGEGMPQMPDLDRECFARRKLPLQDFSRQRCFGRPTFRGQAASAL